MPNDCRFGGFYYITECAKNIIYTDTHTIVLSSTSNGSIINIPLVMYQHFDKMHVCIKNCRFGRINPLKGQTLADGAVPVSVELALGKNVLIVYMPWEGYNSDPLLPLIFLLLHKLSYNVLLKLFKREGVKCKQSSYLCAFTRPLKRLVFKNLDPIKRRKIKKINTMF